MYLKTEKGKRKKPKTIRNIPNIPTTYLLDSSFIFGKLGLWWFHTKLDQNVTTDTEKSLKSQGILEKQEDSFFIGSWRLECCSRYRIFSDSEHCQIIA